MLNIRFAVDYFLHRLKAKTRHGLHSPFVYRLADEVIYDFGPKKVYGEAENLRKKLLFDERTITVTDLGAGSVINNKKTKKIKDIARHALKPAKLAQLLYRLAADAGPKSIIELGTCLGITAIYLQKAMPQARLYTLEGCPETAAIAQETFLQAGLSHLELIRGNFDEKLPAVIAGLENIDFVFIDGNHQKEATLRYFEWCLPKVHPGSLLIFDDIYWSKGMKEAWNAIKANPKVSLTVDLFWIGLVFFRQGQAREHFVIRF